MKFVTMFLDASNVHMYKDVGMIPRSLSKYYNYDSEIVCYAGNDIDKNTENIKIKCLRKSRFAGIRYLVFNAKKIDVLNLYHWGRKTLIYIFLYNFFNRKGITYVKCDMDYKSVDELHNHRKTSKVFEGILKKSDIVSVESTWIKNNLNKYFMTDKIICIPNGVDFNGMLSGNNRENIILTVGRLGMRQKATDILLQSFKNSEVLHKKWKLILVGDVAQEFQNYIDDFFAENPLMKDKIEFTGKISDKKVLEEYYLKSKVFAMPSRWEGFTLAMLEALSYGCYFVGTDKIAPIDDVLSDSDYGIKIESDNVDAFANGLQKVCANENLFTNEMQVKRMNHIRDNFCWEKICGLLDMEIKNKQESLKGTR